MAGAGAGRAGPVIVTGSGFALSQRTRRLGVALIVVTVAAVAVALKSFVLDPLTGHFGGPFEDFQAYLGAARSMAAGGSPYAQFDPSTVVMSGFDYPPFAAVVVRPLGLLGDRAAMVVWLLATLASAVAGAILVARTALPAPGRPPSSGSSPPSPSPPPATTSGTGRSTRSSSSCSRSPSGPTFASARSRWASCSASRPRSRSPR